MRQCTHILNTFVSATPSISIMQGAINMGNLITVSLKDRLNFRFILSLFQYKLLRDELNTSVEITNVQSKSSSSLKFPPWVIFLSQRHNNKQQLRVPLWLLLMIFNINALISGALAAANIFGAIPTSSLNNECSFILIKVGGYEQHPSLQFGFSFFFLVHSPASIMPKNCACHHSQI